MRVVTTDGAGGLVVAERPLPSVPPGGALVRVTACGVCGSDLEKLDGGVRAGSVLGHEVVGLLERPGEESVRVALAHHVPCGACSLCRRGHSSLCAQFVDTGLDPGGFAEWLAVSDVHLADAVFPLPGSVDDLTGTLLEPLSCVLRAVDAAGGAATVAFPQARVHGTGERTSGDEGEGAQDGAGRTTRGVAIEKAQGDAGDGPERVLVAGCGSVGLLFLSVLAAQEPHSHLLYVERDRGRAALAEGLGARPLAEHAVDRAFVTAPAALPAVVEAMAPGGVVVVFAAGRGSTSHLGLDVVYRRELTLVGVRSGSPAHLRRALALLVEGILPLDWLRPDVVGFEGAGEAVARYRRGEALKVVLRP